ncbi:MAG: homocysteine S-methyltransferase family protein [Flavimaricola sp.]|nr:homocysteine S-methyltransferase family protein [Flavimaricola sp.]
MTGYAALLDRLRRGERILIDGGTGSEAEKRGIPTLENAWSGAGVLTHPDIVRGIHEDYIRNGAKIIISNTFSTARNTLADAGAEELFEEANRRGVEIAIEAREAMQSPDVLVAGGISYWSFTKTHPPLDVLEQGIAEQAAIMARAGADLLMLEMMIDIDRMLVTLRAAQTSGLPVWVGFSCRPDAAGTMCLHNGDTLADALDALSDKGVDVVNIMHTDVLYIDECLEIAERHWSGILGVYAHSGHFVDPNWIFENTISPEDYVTSCARWMTKKATVIGGCCGIRPDHIAALHGVV